MQPIAALTWSNLPLVTGWRRTVGHAAYRCTNLFQPPLVTICRRTVGHAAYRCTNLFHPPYPTHCRPARYTNLFQPPYLPTAGQLGVEPPCVWVSQLHITIQNGATSGFDMCFC